MSAPAQYAPSPTPDRAKIGRALISVSDKAGLVEFGRFLAERGVEILSTGGSAKALREAGIKVVEVSDHTGIPEIMDSRVKTLQPAIPRSMAASWRSATMPSTPRRSPSTAFRPSTWWW